MLRNFSISQRIVCFVVIMIAMIISTATVSVFMTEGIIGDGTALAKEMLLDAQRGRIKDITHSQALGLAAMAAGKAEDEQLQVIMQYVDKARFEDDSSGYFYVYKGTVNAVHPTQKQLEGKDLGSTADSRGVLYVKELYKAAQQGGGFVDFVFPKPGAGDVFKLGYAEQIGGTHFWIGTGVYIDNVDKAENHLISTMRAMFHSRLTLYGGIFMAALLLVICPLSYVMVVSITKPLAGITRHARAVAQGNLDEEFETSGRDEVATLQQALSAMVIKLKEFIGQAEEQSRLASEAASEAKLAQAEALEAEHEAKNKTTAMLQAAERLEQVAQAVSTASTQLSAQIEQSDKGAVHSAQLLTEAATAMNQMNASVQEVAFSASSASDAATRTRERALAGAEIVEKAVQSIGSVHEVSLRLKVGMTELNDHSQAITRIMNVISDIADQTNLLALNAAIEAARAGDAGRGFAVVADEVRKLAEKTLASTQDVGNAIAAIQDSTSKSVGDMDKAVEQVELATDFANQSGKALEEIVSTVEATADQVNAIAEASGQQSAASEEINHSIDNVTQVARQTADAMGEAQKAVADLAQQARGLAELIVDMKN
ncbi:HAMP domain-containing protein [Desulfovibrio desulfuricans]|uniref:HAMP domain-containing protein n=1 Tax=Desulfovibrio desulfuricans TaxID=876 RepID=A0A4P7UJM7_DESDE|nr:methyl-accepting chemotaxis protein [Desulfovibrio desulfuricans]QCC84958.1 HAMP domain-containing protein [Desulfovibrio desulfuricans]